MLQNMKAVYDVTTCRSKRAQQRADGSFVERDVMRGKVEAEQLNEQRAGVQSGNLVVMPIDTQVNICYAQMHESRTL